MTRPRASISRMWTYEQATGRLFRDGTLVGTGYSGADEAKNQPDLDELKNRGPIPRGRWSIGPPFASAHAGPYCLPLTPLPGTVTHGRSAFLMHGDSLSAPGTASNGCIILPRPVREEVWASGDRTLEVVATLPNPQPKELA